MGRIKEYYHEEIRIANQDRNIEATIHEKETYNIKKLPFLNVILSKLKSIK